MNLTAEYAVIDAMLICFGGALATLLLGRRKAVAGWLAFACVAASSALVLTQTAQVLQTGPGQAATFLAIDRFGFALRVYVDGLSGVFLCLIALVAVPVAFYAIDYLAHHPEPNVGRYHPNFLLFLAAMYGLVSTTDAVYAPLLIAGVLAGVGVFVWILAMLGGARRRLAAPWLCGYVLETEAHRYQARGFYGELRRWLGRSRGSAPYGILVPKASNPEPSAEPVRSPLIRHPAPPDAEGCSMS